jgi:hypothetical protein
VASLSDDAKEAAREVGLDNNHSALLEAAKADPARQAAVIREIAKEKSEPVRAKRAAKAVADFIAAHVPRDLWDRFRANLYTAGATNIAHELTKIAYTPQSQKIERQ